MATTQDVYVSTTVVRASHAADWALISDASSGETKRLLALAAHKRAAIILTDETHNPVHLLPALQANINVLKFHSHPSSRPGANPLIVCGLQDSTTVIYSTRDGKDWKLAAVLNHPLVESKKSTPKGGTTSKVTVPTAVSSSGSKTASVQALAVLRPGVETASSDSNLLVTGHIDGTLCLWSLTQGSDDGAISAKLECTTALSKVPGSSKSKGSVLPMDAALSRLPGSEHKAWILAVGGTDSRISLWTIKEGNHSALNISPALAITGHSDWVRSLDFVRPSKASEKLLLASGAQDHAIRLWALTSSRSSVGPPSAVPVKERDTETGTEVEVDDFDKLASQVEAKASERDDLDTAAKEFQVGVGETWQLRLEALLSAHDSWVTGVRWAPRMGGNHQPAALLSSSADNSVILWTPSGPPSLVGGLPSFSTTTEESEGSGRGEAGIWVPAHRFGELGIVGSVAHGMMGALWSPYKGDGRDEDGEDGMEGGIYAHGWNGALHLWTKEGEGGQWKTQPAMTGHYKAVRSARWEPRGKYFLSAGADRTTRIHALCTRQDGRPAPEATWREVARPQTHGHDVQSVAWVNRLAFVSAAEEKVVRAFEAPSNFVQSMMALGTLGSNKSQTQDGAYDVLAFNLPTLGHLRAPEHLAEPIKRATELAALEEAPPRRLVMLAISNLFNGCHGDSTKVPRISFRDAEGLLKWTYAQAWKVAIDKGKLLMEVDVLFVPEDAAEGIVGGWTREGACRRFWTVEEPSASLPFLPSSGSPLPPTALAPSGPARPARGNVEPGPPLPQHRCVALGGTFDHLHVGHKILLSVSALIATERIVIGVTDDKMLTKKKNAQLLEDLPTRLKRVDDFIRRFKSSLTPLQRQDVVQLSDVCGPAGYDADIQGLVVTDETIAGAEMIEVERRKNGLNSLERHVIGVIGSGGETEVKGKDAAELAATKVGSTAIRAWLAERKEKGEGEDQEEGGDVEEEEPLDLDNNASLRTTNTETPIGASVPPLALSNRGIFPDSQQQSSADRGSTAPPHAQLLPGGHAVASDTTAVFHRPPTEEELHVSSVWAELHKIYGPPLELLSVDVSDDGRWLASSCQGKTESHSAVHLHDIQSRWAQKQVLKGHSLGVERARFRPNGGHFLITVSRDRSWRLYGRRREDEEGGGGGGGGELFRLLAHEGKAHARIVYDVAWAPTAVEGMGSSGRRGRCTFVTASRDKSIKVWTWSDEGGEDATAIKDEESQQRAPLGRVELVHTVKLEAGARSVAWSERGHVLAVGLENGTLLLFDVSHAHAALGKGEEGERAEGGVGGGGGEGEGEGGSKLLVRLADHHTEAISQLEWRPAVAEERNGAGKGGAGRSMTLLSAGEDGTVRLLMVHL